MLVLSYADLLWRQERTLARLHEFIPELGHDRLSASFVPRLDHDVFKGNHWKVHGSLKGFARKLRPERFGYNVSSCRCRDRPSGLREDEQREAASYVEYLWRLS